MIMNCAICNKQVGFDPGCSKLFRHTWTRIDGVCKYITICDDCFKGREWCLPTAEEQRQHERKYGKKRRRK